MIHFIGKDNIVFHCIIFPAMLKAEGSYILPDNVPANEFLNLEGDKISTSRNTRYCTGLQTVIQPGFTLPVNITLPFFMLFQNPLFQPIFILIQRHNVPANEFLNLEGDKISTSRNWAVWLHEYLEDFKGKQDAKRARFIHSFNASRKWKLSRFFSTRSMIAGISARTS